MNPRACGLVLIAGALVPLLGCSEETQKPPGDTTEPELTVFVPYDSSTLPFVVSDSVDVLIGAHDTGADGSTSTVARVEVYARPAGAAEPIHVGESTAPIPLDSVPEPLRERVYLPAGWELYSVRWHTSWYQPHGGTPIQNGTSLRLFATADDLAGNEARTVDSVSVVVFNTDDSMPVYGAAFVVSPTFGVVGEPFSFDPTPTTDGLSPDHEIFVRWDFDGNAENGWDIDWSADARADQIVTRSFDVQGSRLIRMQAHNAVFPDSICEAPPRVIRVLPLGDPPPPGPVERF